jgi:transcriptional regulator with XRE-family HTH domain
MEQTFAKRPVHQGQNLQKFRFIRNMSQADVATDLEAKRGKPVSQQFISDLENKETIEDEELLRQIAEILKVDVDVIKNLDLEAALNIIANNFHEHATQQINYKNVVHNSPTYNPLDKLVELFEKEKAELKAEIEKLKKGKK